MIYLDPARALKDLLDMKVTVIAIITGALGTIFKVLIRELEELEFGSLVKTIHSTLLLRLARILKRFVDALYLFLWVLWHINP